MVTASDMEFLGQFGECHRIELTVVIAIYGVPYLTDGTQQLRTTQEGKRKGIDR